MLIRLPTHAGAIPPEKGRPQFTGEEVLRPEGTARETKLPAGKGLEKSGRVVQFPRLSMPCTSCTGCGITFAPRASHHRHCNRCFSGAMALQSIRYARLLLGGAK